MTYWRQMIVEQVVYPMRQGHKDKNKTPFPNQLIWGQWTQWSFLLWKWSTFRATRRINAVWFQSTHRSKHACPSDISFTSSVNPGGLFKASLLFPAGRFPLFLIKFMGGISEFHLWAGDTGRNDIQLKTFALWNKGGRAPLLIKSTSRTRRRRW